MDADIGVAALEVLSDEGKSGDAAPGPAAPPGVLPDAPGEGAAGTPEGLFVADSKSGPELGATAGEVGTVDDGPFGADCVS